MKKRVLIVDDFPNTRFVVKFTLEGKGYEVLEASDGNEALKILNTTMIDLVVTDYNMPNMNGGELSKVIRSIPKYKYLPILILTTETDQKKKELVTEYNVTGWVQKPFKIDRFTMIVEKALSQ